MLQTATDRLLQTPASVALEADIQALSYRGTPTTSSSRQTADDVEPGIRFQRGPGFWQASSATEVRSRSESRGQARPVEANVAERSRRPSSETPSGDFVLRQTDRWPWADAHVRPAASPVFGASSVWESSVRFERQWFHVYTRNCTTSPSRAARKRDRALHRVAGGQRCGALLFVE